MVNENLACQEEWPEELIDGKVVAMSPASPNHTLTAGNIYNIFKNYLKKKKCTPISDGVVVHLTDRDHFVPDMMVICDRSRIRQDGVYGAPDLVVEVLSFSTMRNDRTRKKDVYGRCGVREYWLVSPAERAVEVYRTNGTELILHNVYTLYPDWAMRKMSAEQRAAVLTHFQCSLFDDLDISLEDIFEDLLP